MIRYLAVFVLGVSVGAILVLLLPAEPLVTSGGAKAFSQVEKQQNVNESSVRRPSDSSSSSINIASSKLAAQSSGTESRAAETAPTMSAAAGSEGLSSSWQQTLKSGVINTVVSQIPPETLMSLMGSSLPFDRDELESMSDPVTFAGRLTQLATDVDLGYEPNQVSAELTTPSFLVDQEFRPGENLIVNSPETTRIFSHFSLPGYNGADVLVKWYYGDTRSVLSFKRYPVNPDDKMHFVWLDNRDGWQSGNYFVEIYSTDESLTLLSSGNYYVSN